MENPKNVSFEVVVKPEAGQKSMFDEDAFPTTSSLDRYRPPNEKNIEVARKLQKNNVKVHHVGAFSISASCTTTKFEKLFSTKVTAKKQPKEKTYAKAVFRYSPGKGSSWKLPKKDGLDALIDRAYIQHDPMFFANERPTPPMWSDKFRLRVPVDVAQIMRAASVHRRGITGKGVKVVMADTGFYYHPYYVEQGYNFMAVTTPDALDYTTDNNGHGTGECANLFATAPGINFVGLKMNNTTLAIKTAVELNPDIMTNSWGYSVDKPGTSMPNWLKPLYLAVLDAAARGITVCFSAGNGHYGFPGSMPEVISVGGVNVDKNLKYSATNYASGFDSTWFPGRATPDVCGLVGTLPKADYIVLPVQSTASAEKAQGWGAFSGTSAASPMVAGVCALLKEADPNLTPQDIKNLLKFTAKDITTGTNAHGKVAKPGPDSATGFGLVDANRAVETIL